MLCCAVVPALLLPRLPLLQLLTFSTHDLLDPYTFHVEPVTHNMALCIFPALQVVFGPDVLAGNASIITVDKVQLERRGALVGEGSVSGCAGSRQQAAAVLHLPVALECVLHLCNTQATMAWSHPASWCRSYCPTYSADAAANNLQMLHGAFVVAVQMLSFCTERIKKEVLQENRSAAGDRGSKEQE